MLASVVHQIEESARRFPERTALHTPHGACDYATLHAQVAGIQRLMRDAGLPGNRLVGVLTGDQPAVYASILAVLACGCAYVPINSGNPSHRNLAIAADAGLELVLAHRAHPPLDAACAESRPQTRVLRSDAARSVQASWRPPDIASADLAYLFYTSGSTGRPKGVPIHHGNLNAFMDVMLDADCYTLDEHDRFLQMFALTFDLSVTSFLTPLCIGAACHVVPEEGIASFNVIKVLEDYAVTVALMVPSVLFYLRRYFGEIRLPDMRYSLFCGEALPQSLAEEWSHCVPAARLQNLYGPTEATIYCLRYDWNRESSAAEAVNGVVAIGRPFPGMRAFVLDEHGREAAPGERGELCLAGPQVTDRYWNDPERTAQAFFLPTHGTAGPAYRTGDVCFVNARGNFVYCGRTDDQIKVDGYRVELGEIEHHAREGAGGAAAAVVPVHAPDGAVGLVLFVEAPKLDRDAVAAHLEARLPPHMLPNRIERLDAMPLNVNGKIDRRALADRLRSG